MSVFSEAVPRVVGGTASKFVNTLTERRSLSALCGGKAAGCPDTASLRTQQRAGKILHPLRI
jgi:hypothetical protein